LASCKTIGEGIDTKNANMVVFIDPKQSYVEIIQNIGRICRKNENTKGLATVLIPTYVDVNKYKDCQNDEEKDNVIRQEMSKTGNFNGILNVLSALRQEDPYIFELCLKYPDTFTKKEINDNLRKHNLEFDDKEYSKKELFEEYKLKYDKMKSEKTNFEILSDKLNKNIQIINEKILEDDIFIDNNYDETMYFVKINDKYMKTKNKLKNNGKINRCNRNIKPNIHTNDEIKVLWKIESDIDLNKKIFGGYIKATVVKQNVENWLDKLNEVKQYIDKHKKRPSNTDKNIDIKQLGSWLSHQQKNYKNKQYIMKDNKIREIYEKFINDHQKYFMSNDELWLNKLNEVKQYIDKNKKRPSEKDKNTDIKKLGTWLSQQQTNYKNKQKIMKDDKIKQIYEKLINDHQEYFMSNDELWLNKLNEVKQYIDKNKKRPSNTDKNNDVKRLGTWLSIQLQNYKNKQQIMKDDKIKKIYEKFINDHQEYFMLNNELWLNRLDQVKQYVDKHKKRPSNTDKNNDVKRLGSWLSLQQQYYKNKQQIMKDDKIKQIYEKFINDYQEYFMSNDELWSNKLNKVKQYIDKHKKTPSEIDKNNDIKRLGSWLSLQQTNYKNKQQIMKDNKIREIYEKFINDYQKYFMSNEEIWLNNLNKVKQYIDKNNKKPLITDENKDIQKLSTWIRDQQTKYKNKQRVMKDDKIKEIYEKFINDYQEYFPNNPAIQEKRIIKKSTTIKPKTDSLKESLGEKQKRMLSEYQEITKKMSVQNSKNTNEMFKGNVKLWHQYHDNRDISFKGYDNQNEIPINKIMDYLKTKENKKLNILDLGCGRNLIKQYFEKNKKFEITGYDHVSFNGSIECDISELPNDDETVDVCIFSQSLMGSNWKEYIVEAIRVLRYNGELIISESVERYDNIKQYIDNLGLHYKKIDYSETNRWFYLYLINDS